MKMSPSGVSVSCGRGQKEVGGATLHPFPLPPCRWADLLVAAPFYFQRKPEVGGAVYVYLNVGGALGQQASVVLRGPAGSAFGMAVAAVGDLDGDGFQGEFFRSVRGGRGRSLTADKLTTVDASAADFAVGAPFHGTGSVMIWSGGRGGVASQPSQVGPAWRLTHFFLN